MSKPLKAMAILEYNVTVVCPHCISTICLLDGDNGYDDEGEILTAIFNNKWDDLNGHKIECPCCCKEFELSGVEY